MSDTKYLVESRGDDNHTAFISSDYIKARLHYHYTILDYILGSKIECYYIENKVNEIIMNTYYNNTSDLNKAGSDILKEYGCNVKLCISEIKEDEEIDLMT